MCTREQDLSVARLAQSVEHGTLNPRVVGSSPTLGACFFFFSYRAIFYATALFDHARIQGGGGGGGKGAPHKILLPQIVRRGPRGPWPPPYKILDPPMLWFDPWTYRYIDCENGYTTMTT